MEKFKKNVKKIGKVGKFEKLKEDFFFTISQFWNIGRNEKKLETSKKWKN